MGLPRWRGPESKQLGSSGFESRRACHQPLTHCVIVREDLPRGTLAAQIIHAAGESSPGGLPTNTYAIALAARDEAHLALIEQELLERQIPHCAVREPDAPWSDALMAIGIVPLVDRAIVKPVTRSLRLLK